MYIYKKKRTYRFISFFLNILCCFYVTSHHHVSKDVGTETTCDSGSIAVDDGDNSWLLLFHERVL